MRCIWSKVHKIIEQVEAPRTVVVDPVTGLLHAGTASETRSILLRLIDYLKEKQITALITTLTSGAAAMEQDGRNRHLLAYMDAWLLLRDIETGGAAKPGSLSF